MSMRRYSARHNTIYGVLIASLIIILTIVMMSGSVFASVDSAPDNKAGSALPEGITAADWMSALPDEAMLTDLNIPGAHAAASQILLPHTAGISAFAETQDRKIYGNYGLLDLGVRYLDLSYCLDKKSGELTLCSGIYTAAVRNIGAGGYLALTNDALMREIREFLDAHPDETIVIEIDSGIGDRDTADALKDFFKRQAVDPDKAYPEIYTGKYMPSLGEARGKLLILSHLDTASYDINGNGSQWAFRIADPASGGNEDTKTASMSICDRAHRYSVYRQSRDRNVSVYEKSKWVSSSMDKAADTHESECSNGRDSWSIIDCNASGDPDISLTSTAYSDEINPIVQKKTGKDPDRFYGCLLMDHIDGQLSKAVWGTNFARELLPVSYKWEHEGTEWHCTAVRGTAGRAPQTVSVKAEIRDVISEPDCAEKGKAGLIADFSGTDAAAWASAQEMTVALPPTGHSFDGFSTGSTGDTITALCSNEYCPLGHSGISTVLIAPDKDYDGKAYDLAYLYNWDEFEEFVRQGILDKYGSEPKITVEGPDYYETKNGGLKARAVVTIRYGFLHLSKEEFTLNTSYNLLPGTLTVSELFVNDKVYDGTVSGTLRDNISVKGLLDADEDSVSDISVGRVEFDSPDAGYYKKVSLSDYRFEGKSAGLNDLYSFSQASQKEAEADIARRPIRIKAADQVLASGEQINKGINYIIPEGQSRNRGLLKGHSIVEFMLTADRFSETITPSAVKIVDNQGNDVTQNYKIEYQAGFITALKSRPSSLDFKAPSAGQDLVYDGSDQELLIPGENLEYTDDPSDSSRTTSDCSSLTGREAGTYTVWWKPSSSSRWSDISWKALTVDIAPRPVTVSPEKARYTKEYGDEDPQFDYKIVEGPLAEGDRLKGSLSREGGKEAGSYAITIGTLDADNPSYDVTLAGSSVLQISRRTLSVGAVGAADKIYDGSSRADIDRSRTVLQGRLRGDDVYLAAEKGSFDSPDAGKHVVRFSGISLSGADADNYKLADDVNDTVAVAAIQKRPLIVTAKHQSVTGLNDIDHSTDFAAVESFNARESRGILAAHSLESVTLRDGRSLSEPQNTVIASGAVITDKDGNKETSNYDISYVDGSLSVINNTVIEEPEALFSEYDGKAHPLIRAGSVAAGYVMQYASSPNGPWDEKVPEATKPGTRTLWYRVVKTGEQPLRSASASEPVSYFSADTSHRVDTAVTRRITSINWDQDFYPYDGYVHQPAGEVSNLVEGDVCKVVVRGGASGKGTHTATATGLSNPDYAISDVYSNASHEYKIADVTPGDSSSEGSGKSSDSGSDKTSSGGNADTGSTGSTDPVNGDSSSGSDTGSNSSSSKDKSNNARSVRTGDNAYLLIWTLLLMFAVIEFELFLIRHIKERKR